ncbi:hypothetical protein D2E72_00950 [Mycobacteroides abscessus]|nr:hypothetical protein D2E72_00950 [Mycobacteroides abscessus]
MNKVSNHLSLFTIREYLIFEVASLKMLSIVSDSLSPNSVCVLSRYIWRVSHLIWRFSVCRLFLSESGG